MLDPQQEPQVSDIYHFQFLYSDSQANWEQTKEKWMVPTFLRQYICLLRMVCMVASLIPCSCTPGSNLQILLLFSLQLLRSPSPWLHLLIQLESIGYGARQV